MSMTIASRKLEKRVQESVVRKPNGHIDTTWGFLSSVEYIVSCRRNSENASKLVDSYTMFPLFAALISHSLFGFGNEISTALCIVGKCDDL